MNENKDEIKVFLIKLTKEFFNQGDSYFAYEVKNRNWEFGYSNDYPMQHGDGCEMKLPTDMIKLMMAKFQQPLDVAIPTDEDIIKWEDDWKNGRLEGGLNGFFTGAKYIRDKWISHNEYLQSQLKERDKEIEGLNDKLLFNDFTALPAKDAEIENLQSQLTEKDKEIERLKLSVNVCVEQLKDSDNIAIDFAIYIYTNNLYAGKKDLKHFKENVYKK